MSGRSIFDDVPGGKDLYTLISEARWQRAAEQLNSWNEEGISAALKELRPRQIESLYLGAVANDRVGETSNIARMTLAASPELAKARAAVVASGVSIKEFVDYAGGPGFTRTNGDPSERYGFGRYWTIRGAARSLDPAHLNHLSMEGDKTVYQHPSGRVGTNAEETPQKVAEFTPPSTALGTAGGLVARAAGMDENRVRAAEQGGDLVGDVLGGIAAAGTQRAGYQAVQSTRSGPVVAEVRTQENTGEKGGASPGSTTRVGSDTPPPQRTSAGPPATGGAIPPSATPREESPVKKSTTPAGNAPAGTAPGPVTSAPADVGDTASKARIARDVENTMRANMRNTIGVGGEAAWRNNAATTTMDLNAIKTDFPQLDSASRQTFASVKAFGVGKPLDDAVIKPVIKRYDRELQSLRTPEEPGVPTKLGQAVDLIATKRDSFQAAGAWPTGLAKDATPAQIAKFINQQGVLAIPSDHVKLVQNAVAASAHTNPEAYGLTKGPGLEKGIARLTARVQSLGLTSGEIADISKKVFSESAQIRTTPTGQGGATPPPTTRSTTPPPTTPTGQGGATPPPTPPPRADEVKGASKKDGPKSAVPPQVRSTP